MTDLYFSRARLVATHAGLGPVLFPDEPSRRIAVAHRLVWTMFSPETGQRPFLFREEADSLAAGREARGAFYVLSHEPPGDGGGLFTLETKPFRPQLSVGERVRFSLRANPTVQRTVVIDGRRKTQRYDVAMHALHKLGAGERSAARLDVVREAGLAWLERHGPTSGFRLPDRDGVNVEGYDQFLVDPEKRRKGARAVHTRLEFEGELEVTDPSAFLQRVASGFGRARAFGNGLMLIRRAS